MNCCGWDGPKDFAYNNEPIDASCYEEVEKKTNSGVWPRVDTNDGDSRALVPTKKMKEVIFTLKLGVCRQLRNLL